MRAGKLGPERSELVDDIEDRLALCARLHVLEIEDRVGIEIDSPLLRRPCHEGGGPIE
jgi:hypothetical protein